MPPTLNGMTRMLIEGVPVWKNAAGELFYYSQDTTQPPLKIGSLEGGFEANWAELLEERLTAYRAAAATPRTRAAGGAPKKN